MARGRGEGERGGERTDNYITIYNNYKLKFMLRQWQWHQSGVKDLNDYFHRHWTLRSFPCGLVTLDVMQYGKEESGEDFAVTRDVRFQLSCSIKLNCKLASPLLITRLHWISCQLIRPVKFHPLQWYPDFWPWNPRFLKPPSNSNQKLFLLLQLVKRCNFTLDFSNSLFLQSIFVSVAGSKKCSTVVYCHLHVHWTCKWLYIIIVYFC